MQNIFQHAVQATSKRVTLIVTVVAGFLMVGLSAHAQGYYYINGEPAPPNVAQVMAAYGMPFAEQIAAVAGDHLDAGANHVCLQSIGVDGVPRSEWTALASALGLAG